MFITGGYRPFVEGLRVFRVVLLHQEGEKIRGPTLVTGGNRAF